MPRFAPIRVPCAAISVVFATSSLLAAAPSQNNTASQPSSHEQDQTPFPSPAHPFRLEATAGAGFGSTTLSSGETINAYGPGLGLHAGYTFEIGVAIALQYQHFFGTTSSYPIPLVALIEHRTGASFASVDLGFEFTPSHAIFRPHVGLGIAGLRKSIECSPVDGSFSALARDVCHDYHASHGSWSKAIAPGLLMGLGFDRYYGFVDLQYLIPDDAEAFIVTGGFGLTL
ncbi:MAG TPA: hypothetical protein PLJ27_12370 [Polyangiaceae bacterium]|jgi:hypothetical protein|nr:MAG: hypothetical protein BWY17_01052 [Deltaproteobacteria bacterium ADurb.Bin207]HNS95927.1 hypothetical protein [Polyangiaceae bacterium]HNZ22546.1 hypothetical protein [Polyangiaceae bacterium]HOD23627.1 hypothetical protein [Polyangiaceae bacterium]HOE50107.1 hypothetical protein [Polyangiaceae bacterium]